MRLWMIVAILFLFFFTVHAKTAEKPITSIVESSREYGLERPEDAAKVAREIVRSFLSEDIWRMKVEETRRRFDNWHKDTGGDLSQFLNDRVIVVALAASSGKIEKLQDGIVWLAFYHEFQQPLPPLLLNFLKKSFSSVQGLLNEFTWDRASIYVREKQWRRDLKISSASETEHR